MNKKILICGFSGSGKSTALKIIQDWDQKSQFLAIQDLDQRILRSHSAKAKSISELIEKLGWDEFRKIERGEFESFLKEESPAVLALGGGTLNPLVWDLYGSARSLKWLHIEADFESCFKRLKLDVEKEARPLLKLGEMELRRIYQEREVVFKKIPSRIINKSTIEEFRSQVVHFLEEILS